ncbi:MAG: CvpA family protein [Planctomycetes bacterium]|jgi:uncharacterized membrane protein required for colicin V production|nr:CvpA family protein [Planctomycetota bacterium]HNZ66040.1 CvpA family protein [Planctomycetota bacterium]HPY74069.1 CvpA family protein [Planctomycetota bacterium]HQA99615.1 CvpA family protein [Planctomycetota bacterium]
MNLEQKKQYLVYLFITGVAFSLLWLACMNFLSFFDAIGIFIVVASGSLGLYHGLMQYIFYILEVYVSYAITLQVYPLLCKYVPIFFISEQQCKTTYSILVFLVLVCLLLGITHYIARQIHESFYRFYQYLGIFLSGVQGLVILYFCAVLFFYFDGDKVLLFQDDLRSSKLFLFLQNIKQEYSIFFDIL